MHYVYLIESVASARRKYAGFTDNLRPRLGEHNEGKSAYTAQYRSWKLVTYVAFAEKSKALEFERYLKVGSSHAFARRHFW